MNLNQRISPNLSETPSRRQAQACLQRGFTLIELMVVIAILGILMVIGNASWGAYRQATRVDSAKEKVVSILQQTRLKALTSGMNQALTIDYVNNTLTDAAGRVVSFGDVNLEHYVKGPPCVVTDPAPAPGGQPFTLVFRKRGSVGGLAARTIKVSLPISTKSYIIKINGTTGRISVGTPSC